MASPSRVCQVREDLVVPNLNRFGTTICSVVLVDIVTRKILCDICMLWTEDV